MKQIGSAGIDPAWNTEVDQWTTVNKDSEKTDMDKNQKDNMLSSRGRVFFQNLWKNKLVINIGKGIHLSGYHF